MEKINKETTEKIVKFLSELKTEIDVNNYVDIENIDFVNAYDSVYNMIADNNGFDIDIIYYITAIEYLQKNDPSLKESLEIAADYGFETKNLSSEILASLLATRNARDEFLELVNEINTFFENL